MIAVGQFGAPSGVKGLLRLNSFTESPEHIFSFQHLYVGNEKKRIRIRPFSSDGHKFVAAVEDISRREEAQKLSGSILYVERNEFPDIATNKEYYQVDLLGLDVFDEKEKCVGRICAFHNFGAGALFEILLLEGAATVMVPFRDDVIMEIDFEKSRMTARLRDWM